MTFTDLFNKLVGKKDLNRDMMKAGTGFMVTLSDTIRKLQKKGYVENLTARFDRLECRSGAIKMYPGAFIIDEVVRFENASDPDDQSILYAISSPSKKIKGVYVESFGAHHDEMSAEMNEYFRDHLHRALLS